MKKLTDLVYKKEKGSTALSNGHIESAKWIKNIKNAIEIKSNPIVTLVPSKEVMSRVIKENKKIVTPELQPWQRVNQSVKSIAACVEMAQKTELLRVYDTDDTIVSSISIPLITKLGLCKNHLGRAGLKFSYSTDSSTFQSVFIDDLILDNFVKYIKAAQTHNERFIHKEVKTNE